jgi:hypothetical protein
MSAFEDDLAKTAFSRSDIRKMREILASKEKIHETDNETAQKHAEHCLHQMVRFPHLAIVHGESSFRAAQWGVNMGRVQQILGSTGGVNAWWRAFEDIIKNKDWLCLKSKVETYIRLLGLEPPSDEFINRL